MSPQAPGHELAPPHFGNDAHLPPVLDARSLANLSKAAAATFSAAVSLTVGLDANFRAFAAKPPPPQKSPQSGSASSSSSHALPTSVTSPGAGPRAGAFAGAGFLADSESSAESAAADVGAPTRRGRPERMQLPHFTTPEMGYANYTEKKLSLGLEPQSFDAYVRDLQRVVQEFVRNLSITASRMERSAI